MTDFVLDRRHFLTAATALVVPLPALAQFAQVVHRIGYVGFFSTGSGFEAFRDALRELGYVEGNNLIIEARFARGYSERLPAIMAELINLKVKAIVAVSTQTVLAAMRATTTIPIVFASVFDPVGSGLVANLAQPGGNVTGVAIGVGGSGLGGKWLQMLKEVTPTLSHVAVLSNPANPASAASLQEIEAAARDLRVRLDALDAGTKAKLDNALAEIDGSGAQGLIVTNDPLFTPIAARLVEFAASRRLPAVYFFSSFAEAGGLMAYGASTEGTYRRAAIYVDKVLKGANPGSLPVEQPARFKLVINLKTAKALGITLPESLLVSADEVIE